VVVASYRPTGDPRPHPASPGRPRGRPSHCPPPTTTTTPKPTLRWPSTACASLERQAPTSGRRRAILDTAGDHAHPGPSQPCGCLPYRNAPRRHSGRTQRPPEPTDTGHRRPDTGHLDTQTPAPDTGHRSLGQAPVGHRTLAPDTSRERGHGDDSTASIRTSFHPAERPHAGTPNRVPALALQPADRPLPRPSRASAHCSRVLDLDSTSGGQWDEGKVGCAGSGWWG
jgi:hypothetical protein